MNDATRKRLAAQQDADFDFIRGGTPNSPNFPKSSDEEDADIEAAFAAEEAKASYFIR